MTTQKALQLVIKEREQQREIGTDGLLTGTNNLLAVALAYMGRASVGVLRNERENLDKKEMLVKATAVLLAALEELD